MLQIKDGVKTLEFYLLLAAGAAKIIWKDFPTEALGAIITYAVARSVQKGFGLTGPDGKPSWKTTEFWLTVFFSVAKSVFPDLPEESFAGVLTWIGARTGLKITAAIQSKNGSATTTEPTS